MKKWKVGIVGLSRGRGFVQVFGAHPRVEVSALCDVDEDRLTQTGEAFKLPGSRLFTSFDDFLNSPIDIVTIATPIPFHAEQTIKSVESGRHVLCEQTAAYTIEECERIVEAVKGSGMSYSVCADSSNDINPISRHIFIWGDFNNRMLSKMIAGNLPDFLDQVCQIYQPFMIIIKNIRL